MKKIPLTQGYFAIVDDADYEELAKRKWCVSGDSRTPQLKYAVRRLLREEAGGSARIVVKMHNVLCPPPPGFIVDHINGNALDNRRSNLRIATRGENQRNTKIHRDNKSGFKGVTRRELVNGCVFEARIMCGGVRYELGKFETAEAAAEAYREAALRIHGEFSGVLRNAA